MSIAVVRWSDSPFNAWRMTDGVGERMVHAFWIAAGLPTFVIGDTAYIGGISTSTFPRNHP